jgi:hypothetical protein
VGTGTSSTTTASGPPNRRIRNAFIRPPQTTFSNASIITNALTEPDYCRKTGIPEV